MVFYYCDKELWSLVFLVSERTGITETLPVWTPFTSKAVLQAELSAGDSSRLLTLHGPGRTHLLSQTQGRCLNFLRIPRQFSSPSGPVPHNFKAGSRISKGLPGYHDNELSQRLAGKQPESMQVPTHSAGEATVCGRCVYDASSLQTQTCPEGLRKAL